MSDHEHMAEEQPQHPGGPTHGPNGDFIATVETAERDAEAARLRSRGLSYRAIAAQQGVDVHTAHDRVHRALAAIRAEGAAEARTLELERLDLAQAAVMQALEAKHFTVNQGRVIYLGEDPMPDYGPVLAAVDRLVKISESRRKLLGLDAEQKVSVSGGVTYEIIGIAEGDL